MTPRDIHGALCAAGIAGDWITRGELETLTTDKGAYALVLQLAKTIRLDIAKFAGCAFEPGWYIYLGSAQGPGGLRARLRRHFQTEKKLHWHIDRLSQAAVTHHALAVKDGNECALMEALLDRPGLTVPLPGFGSTDCRLCPSHLLRLTGSCT